MAFFGRNYKIGGLYCGHIMRMGAHGQTYQIAFEREFATLEQIEAIDWEHLTVETLPTASVPCPLSADYAYKLIKIDYNSDGRYYTASVQMARRLWGDVTGYQAEIDTLQAKVTETTTALLEATDLIQGMVDAEVEEIMSGIGGEEDDV